MTIQELDPQRQERAKAYGRISRRLMLVSWMWSAVYAIFWLVIGWSADLKTLMMAVTGNEWLLLATFAAVFAGISAIIEMPLNYYSGFVLPHRFEMSNQTLKDWILDQGKGFLVGAPIGLFVLELIYLFLRTFPETWWLWAAGFMLVFSVILGSLAPVLIMPIFNKFIPLESEYADLAERLVRLAERANTRVKGVYKFDMSRRTKAANAALTGIGASRRIILGDTLLEEFEPDEIEAVLAHELGHHVNKDIPTGILINGVTTLVGLYLASLALQAGIRLFGFESTADVAALPLLILVLGAYGLVTMPLGNAWSRWRERKADRYALEATGSGLAYASAMTRLANQNLADADPEPWVEFMLHSHPALGKRIEMAKEYERSDPQ
jgi:STE24 endopeptidase